VCEEEDEKERGGGMSLSPFVSTSTSIPLGLLILQETTKKTTNE
jgi:hypothetical protein